MEGIASLGGGSGQNYSVFQYSAKLEINATILQGSLSNSNNGQADSVSLDSNALFQSLTATSKSIVDKLNEILKAKLPDGVQSLKPEEVTPEATADRIVKGATAFFDNYAKQNPNLSGEDLLKSFLEKVTSGVQKGYDDAYGTLKDLGAFDVDGVQAGVEKTKILIDSKLKEFEASKRKELGLDNTVDQNAADITKSALLASAGANLNLVA